MSRIMLFAIDDTKTQKIELSNEVAQKEKDGNSKEHSYEIENCYTIGPR